MIIKKFGGDFGSILHLAAVIRLLISSKRIINMLRLIENKSKNVAAQREFANNLSSSWSKKVKRKVVWRPSSKVLDLVTDGQYWFAPPKLSGSEYYWNTFGEYEGKNSLQIAVEINVPVAAKNRQYAGFFASDELTGTTYILHDGGVGGGRKGIGRNNFLWQSGAQTTPVLDSEGKYRHGIIITATADKDIGTNVAKFIQSVADFKQAATNGELSTAAAEEAAKTYSDYFREFSGTKKGTRATEFEYISRHGDIVDALSKWRKSTQMPSETDRIVKDAYIDLGIESREGMLTELYEVKTSGDRQSLYTAIGQITVHSTSSPQAKRFIVLPHGSKVATDIQSALCGQSIQILYFKIQGQRVSIYKFKEGL